jgi:hypothetical protein
MSNHTSGPWKAELEAVEDQSSVPTVFIFGPSGVGMGRVAMAYAECGRESELLSNARLIAAAPELLEMLSDIAQELHISSEMGGMTEKACRFYRDSIREFITKKLEE